MTESTHLSVVFVILVVLTALSLVGTFVTSPVMAIFSVVFLAGAVAVAWDLRNQL
jgi:hypothetical protein